MTISLHFLRKRQNHFGQNYESQFALSLDHFARNNFADPLSNTALSRRRAVRAASTGILARTGAVRSGSVREPAESGAAIKGGESIRPGTPIQVLPRRRRQRDGYEGSCSGQVGYNPLRRAILDRWNGRFCRGVALAALAVGAALAVSAAMTAGVTTSRRGLARRNQTAIAAA